VSDWKFRVLRLVQRERDCYGARECAAGASSTQSEMINAHDIESICIAGRDAGASRVCQRLAQHDCQLGTQLQPAIPGGASLRLAPTAEWKAIAIFWRQVRRRLRSRPNTVESLSSAARAAAVPRICAAH
jgi:hypothetical protein